MDFASLKRLADGFTSVPGTELPGLATWCRDACVHSGDARFCVLGDVLSAFSDAWSEASESGGLRVAVVDAVSDALRRELPDVLADPDAASATIAAARLRSEVFALLRPNVALDRSMPTESAAAEVARLLLATPGGVTFSVGDRYEFASGLRSPIYVDCRTLVSSPTTRASIIEILSGVAGGMAPVGGMVGVATAGIPWAAWLSERLNADFAYVRPAAKDRGRKRAVEGSLPERSRILVVEDLITTGTSSLNCVTALRDLGYEVAGLVSLFSYGLAYSGSLFRQHDVSWVNLCGVGDLMEAAATDSSLSAHVEILQSWQANEASRFVPAT